MFRNRKGFTLIELLIVVVIIGILAAIALPKFGQTRERAYQSAMKSDLRNFQTSAEMYYNDNYQYPGALANIDYQFSAGVASQTYTYDGTNIGYTLVLQHEGLPVAKTCTLTVSQAAGTADGIICVDL